MMITFSPKELLAEDREKLPRVANLAKRGREVDRLPRDPYLGAEQLIVDPLVAVGGVKNMNIVRLVANDPESMAISIRPAQRLQHLALQVRIIFHLPGLSIEIVRMPRRGQFWSMMSPELSL